MEVGPVAKTRPPTRNRSVAPYREAGQRVTLYGQSYRAGVVHSSAHDQRRQKRMERERAAEPEVLKDSFSKQCLGEYACREDAEQSATRWSRQPCF
jgi:hypothetical protein